jgi:hypothetical protein
MLDLAVYFLFYYGIIVLLGIALLKAVLFVTFKTRNWKMHHLLFFDQQNLDNTLDGNRERIKRLQNMLSLFALVVLMLTIIIKFLYKD